MAIGKTKSTFPDCPVDDIPETWMSIDPAAGKKPTVAVLWERAVAKQFVNMNHDRLMTVEKKLGMASLIVMEGGGFMSANAASSLKLERVREGLKLFPFLSPCRMLRYLLTNGEGSFNFQLDPADVPWLHNDSTVESSEDQALCRVLHLRPRQPMMTSEPHSS